MGHLRKVSTSSEVIAIFSNRQGDRFRRPHLTWIITLVRKEGSNLRAYFSGVANGWRKDFRCGLRRWIETQKCPSQGCDRNVMVLRSYPLNLSRNGSGRGRCIPLRNIAKSKVFRTRQDSFVFSEARGRAFESPRARSLLIPTNYTPSPRFRIPPQTLLLPVFDLSIQSKPQPCFPLPSSSVQR